MAGRPTLYHRQVSLPQGMRVHRLGMGGSLYPPPGSVGPTVASGRRGPTLAKATSRFTRKGRSRGTVTGTRPSPRYSSSRCRADCATKGGAQWQYDLCIAGCKAMENLPF